MTKTTTIGWMLICSSCIVGCGNNDSVAPATSAQPSASSSKSTGSMIDSSTTLTPNYAKLFDAMVQGSLLDATDQHEDASTKAIEKVERFNETENKAFVDFLQQRLAEKDSFSRLAAAFHLTRIRIDTGVGEQNRDLIPVFVDLLQHDDVAVRKFSLIDMHLLVQKSGLGEELQPLVQPLIRTLQDSSTTYLSMTSLGAIGPVAKEAVPFMKRAAERDNTEIIDEVCAKAIHRIEGGAR